ncbi:MAG: hypothetical protein H6507_01880 [Calditrichaeota bacterium]|nr:hypothetical protein [Calditrichota bacterium]
MTKYILTFICAVSVVGVLSCSDPRTAPTSTPNPTHTESITLWEDAVSNGQIISADFEVLSELAQIGHYGIDTPARLTVAAFIEPDADIAWYESVVNDSLPAWDEEFIRYLVAIEEQQGTIDSVNAIRTICDSIPNECPSDTSGLIPAEDAALAIQAVYQDSVDVAAVDTTRLGQVRDSLGLIVDDRFTLALWMDDDTTTAYPEALKDSLGRLGGQEIYLAMTDGRTGMKGRSFQIDLSQFEGADLNKPTRPIEFNWSTCFIGSTRPCMSVGLHTLHARVTGTVSKITAAVVLVYAEDLP